MTKKEKSELRRKVLEEEFKGQKKKKIIYMKGKINDINVR